MLGRLLNLLAVVGCVAASAPAWAWAPEQSARFDVQFVTPFNLVRGVDVAELDLFDTSADQIKALNARGVRTICYVNAGAWENWRVDSRDFPATAIGRNFSGWPGERWVDVRQIDQLGPLLRKRIELCRSKGFDGIEFDNVDGYANRTGFPLTAKDQLAFIRWLAGEAKKAKLAVGLKNSLELVPDLVGEFDFAISESCFTQGQCEALKPFRAAGKAVYVIEYTNQLRKMDRFCDEARDLGVQLIFKTKSLNGKLHRRCP
jgi:endo-alpha-1,4-polygalactosaminidase (GH114 family)